MDTDTRAMMRKHIDNRLSQIKPYTQLLGSKSGWVKAIRQALGMSAQDLAERMKFSSVTSVYKIEQGEVNGSTTLNSLRRAAEALDCSLVYALVPNRPLSQMVDDQARQLAEREVSNVRQSMRLENQETSSAETDELVTRLADQFKKKLPRSFWKVVK